MGLVPERLAPFLSRGIPPRVQTALMACGIIVVITTVSYVGVLLAGLPIGIGILDLSLLLLFARGGRLFGWVLFPKGRMSNEEMASFGKEVI